MEKKENKILIEVKMILVVINWNYINWNDINWND